MGFSLFSSRLSGRTIALVSLVSASSLITGCQNMQGMSMDQWFKIGSQVAAASGYGDQANQAEAVKETLSTSAQIATSSFGSDGTKISLPDNVQPVADGLRKFGLGSYVDKVEGAMNQAAEQAAAEANPILQDSIKEMSVTDAVGIVTGGETAATDFFRNKTQDSVQEKFRPVIQQNLQKTGFYDQYKSMLDVYNALPLADKPNLDVEDYVLNQSLNLLYNRIGEQEKQIRANPMEYGSKLLQQTFGGSSQ